MARYMAALLLLGVVALIIVARERQLRRRHRNLSRRRRERTESRARHWNFLERLFGNGPKRLTYRPPDPPDDNRVNP